MDHVNEYKDLLKSISVFKNFILIKFLNRIDDNLFIE